MQELEACAVLVGCTQIGAGARGAGWACSGEVRDSRAYLGGFE